MDILEKLPLELATKVLQYIDFKDLIVMSRKDTKIKEYLQDEAWLENYALNRYRIRGPEIKGPDVFTKLMIKNKLAHFILRYELHIVPYFDRQSKKYQKAKYHPDSEAYMESDERTSLDSDAYYFPEEMQDAYEDIVRNMILYRYGENIKEIVFLEYVQADGPAMSILIEYNTYPSQKELDGLYVSSMAENLYGRIPWGISKFDHKPEFDVMSVEEYYDGYIPKNVRREMDQEGFDHVCTTVFWDSEESRLENEFLLGDDY